MQVSFLILETAKAINVKAPNTCVLATERQSPDPLLYSPLLLSGDKYPFFKDVSFQFKV